MELDINRINIIKAIWADYQGMSEKEKTKFKKTAPKSVIDIINKLESAENKSTEKKAS